MFSGTSLLLAVHALPQVAHALSALHSNGGTHRNINADSVYLDEIGQAKLGGYQCLKVIMRVSDPCPSPGLQHRVDKFKIIATNLEVKRQHS